jgi:hypothetical protein
MGRCRKDPEHYRGRFDEGDMSYFWPVRGQLAR